MDVETRGDLMGSADTSCSVLVSHSGSLSAGIFVSSNIRPCVILLLRGEMKAGFDCFVHDSSSRIKIPML